MDSYMATIMGWAPNFAPRSWAFCAGQTIAIAQNSALFSLLGTTFGGNGVSTFALPNLASRLPIGAGQGPGLSGYALGQQGGNENAMLSVNNLPQHNHSGDGQTAKLAAATSTTGTTLSVPAADSILGAPHFSDPNTGGQTAVNAYAPAGASPAVAMALPVAGSTGMTGNSQPFAILPPFLAINWIICMEGIYPSRP